MSHQFQHFFSDRFDLTSGAVQEFLDLIGSEAVVSVSESNDDNLWYCTVWYDQSQLTSEVRQAVSELESDVRIPFEDGVAIESVVGDSLFPGQHLSAGEFLSSADGRFRLYLLEDGRLEAYLYAVGQRNRQNEEVNKRIKIYPVFPYNNRDWPTAAGEGSRLVMPEDARFHGAQRMALVNSSGGTVWNPICNFSGRGSSSHRFVMQNDGNIVHYVEAGGRYRAWWASGSDNRADDYLPKAVPPSVETLVITAGQLAIDSGTRNNADIINQTGAPLAVRDGQRFASIPNGESVPAASFAGVLQIDACVCDFDLSGPEADEGRNSADATHSVADIRKEGSPNTRIRVTASRRDGSFRLA